MPALQARDTKSGPNVGLIVALIVGALILIGVLVAVLIFMLKRRRAARNESPPGTHYEQFSVKTRRSYPGHDKNNSESMGPLLQDAAPSNWVPQHHVQYSYGGEDYELGPHVTESGPITYVQRSPPPGLRLAIPESPPKQPAKPLHQKVELEQQHPPPSPAPASADSCDSESMYSERSASASTRMHTVDLASPVPPVPVLPQYLRRPPAAPLVPVPDVTRPTPAPTSTPASRSDTDASLDSDLSPSPSSPIPPSHTRFLRPLSELPPEAPPLARGDTVLVSHLLKSRAAKRGSGPERSFTRTSRIERADSIREAPSPVSAAESLSPGVDYAQGEDVDTRRPTLDPGFAGTLEYYSTPSTTNALPPPPPPPHNLPPSQRVLRSPWSPADASS
ncbi:hypothetical protein DFH08DRAFT_898609 [Mycena albidolilacea]|uniref:Uncharacterized protein n=1 Tax=Mycena albidolilacea TaxID=1033008 RepID=A0AAD6Z7F0_9AGAR|nr:hypothetical protein DFH08DRAFT_898609 [Mycena albidolilacea]